MNHFREHIPNFITGRDAEGFAFATTEQLLASAAVSSWRGLRSMEFHRFSLARDPLPGSSMLMAEFDGGRSFYVVGYLESAEGLDLPTWTHPSEATP